MPVPRAFFSHEPLKFFTLGVWNSKTPNFTVLSTFCPFEGFSGFVVVGLECSNDSESYAGSITAAGEASHGGRVEDDGTG